MKLSDYFIDTFKNFGLNIYTFVRGNNVILFISTKNSIHEQSQKLLLALLREHLPIHFACLANSENASFASANSMAFSELTQNGIIEYFTLRKLVRELKATHLHVFDEKAAKLAWYLKKSFPFLRIIGDWHNSIDFIHANPLTKENPYLYAFEKDKIDVLFASSPEFVNFLQRQKNMGRVGYLSHVPMFEKYQDSSLDKVSADEVFTFYTEINCSEESGFLYVLNAMQELSYEQDIQKYRLILCVENSTQVNIVLEQAEKLGVTQQIIICDRKNKAVFFSLADAIICSSCDGEGDYKMLFLAWYKKVALIASDLSVHTKFVLSDSTTCALLYPRDDAHALAKNMVKIMKNSSLRSDIILQGAEKVKRDVLERVAADYMKKLHLGKYKEHSMFG